MLPVDEREDVVRRCLIACLAGRWEPASLNRGRELASDARFDWDRWLDAAREESLSPLLHSILRDRDWVPIGVGQRLRQAYLQSGARNALLMAELESVIDRLAAVNVAVIVLKGAALAETVYGNVALRPMVDLDLLVRWGDVQAALGVLNQAGYRFAALEAQVGVTLAYENELMLHKSGPLDVLLEMHWHLLDSPYYQRTIDLDWFWQTARPASFGRSQALVLGLEAQLLHLCAHLALHHGGEWLLWRHDVAEVVHAFPDRIDWDLVLAKARLFDLVLSLQKVLPAVSAEWGAPIPENVLHRLEALTPSPAEVRVFNRLTAADRPVVQRFWTDLAGQASWRTRFAYALTQLFPSPAYMQARYRLVHPWLTPLAYPYRWAIGLEEWLAGRRRTTW